MEFGNLFSIWIQIFMEVDKFMETKEVILELRNKEGLSQDELAEKVYVTR